MLLLEGQWGGQRPSRLSMVRGLLGKKDSLASHRDAGMQKLGHRDQLKSIIPECVFKGNSSRKVSKATCLFPNQFKVLVNKGG